MEFKKEKKKREKETQKKKEKKEGGKFISRGLNKRGEPSATLEFSRYYLCNISSVTFFPYANTKHRNSLDGTFRWTNIATAIYQD